MLLVLALDEEECDCECECKSEEECEWMIPLSSSHKEMNDILGAVVLVVVLDATDFP